MKYKIIVTVLVISLGINVFLFGKWFLDRGHTPSPEEQIILSEMVQKTVESKDYKKLAAKENVIAIDANMDKNKGGVFPYYFGVSVRTDKNTFLFSCSDEVCTDMKTAGTTYSIYMDEQPRVPFKK